MGCDIHAHIEYKKLDYWQHFASVYIPRDYNLFARVANVRSFVKEADIPPRGFPEDACCVTKERYEKLGSDAHTPSWLTYSEFWPAVALAECDDGHTEHHIEVKAIMAAMASLQSAGKQTRLVFWFDN